MNTQNKQPEIVKTKQSYAWHVASECLTSLYHVEEVMHDEKFIKLLGALEAYVDEKIAPPVDKPILNMYVVIEQESD